MGVGGQHHAPAALPPGRTRYPLYMRLGGPQGRSGRVRKISPTTGIRSPDHPVRSESLYRLSHPGPHKKCVHILIQKPKREGILGNLTRDWGIILKWNLKKQDVHLYVVNASGSRYIKVAGLVKKAVKFWCPQSFGNFWTSWANINISRTILLHLFSRLGTKFLNLSLCTQQSHTWGAEV